MKHLRCKLKGHSLAEIVKAGIHIKEFECSSCKKKFTTDGYGRIVKYTRFWEKNHAFFVRYLEKKIAS